MGFHSDWEVYPASTRRPDTTRFDTIEAFRQNNDKVYLNSDIKTFRKRFPKTFSSLLRFPRWILRYHTLPKWCAQLHKKKSIGNIASMNKIFIQEKFRKYWKLLLENSSYLSTEENFENSTWIIHFSKWNFHISFIFNNER